MNQEDIKIKNVAERIPTMLINKFAKLGLENLQEISNIDLYKFSKMKGIGRSAVLELTNFKKEIEENLEDFYNIQIEKQKIHIFPIDYESINSNSFIELINESVIDYVNRLDEVEKSVVFNIYGINDLEKYSLEELGNYHSKSRERIRQIKNKILKDLQDFFNGSNADKLKCRCHEQIISQYNKFHKLINERRILSRELIDDILDEQFFYDRDYSNTVDLLIDIYGLTVCGKTETSFTSTTIILVPELDKGQIIKLARFILSFLKKEVTVVNQMQLIINCRRKNKNLSNWDISQLITTLQEVETIQSSEDNLYQIRFESLSNATDRAYRILLEKSDTMYIDDIVIEINKKLLHSTTSKIYNRDSLTLATDKRFIAQGKTGFWNLKIWNKNSYKIETLVKNALYNLDKPSTSEEIFVYIQAHRPEVKENSIRAIIGMHCLNVENEKWILPEWKKRYSDISLVKRKRRESTLEPKYRIEQRKRIMIFLEHKDNKSAFSSDIIKAIEKVDKKYSRPSFYKMFNQEKYFSKTEKGNKIIISLKQTDKNSISSLEEHNWKNVKQKLSRDVKSYFQENHNPDYQFSIEAVIDLFYKLLNYQINESELSGLKDRVLGNLNKFYTDSLDRVDKLNSLKQFLTCLEPMLKKILYIVNHEDYVYICAGKKGLGEVIGKLSKLDEYENRFKNERTARKYKFGKEIQSVYSHRNYDSHAANDWTELQIATVITNCFVVYLYTCAEYFEEINLVVN